MIISSAWGGASGQNYNSMLGARIFQGIALAPFESLVNASVGDLYFVHVSIKGCQAQIALLIVTGAWQANGGFQRCAIWRFLPDTGDSG